MPWCSGNDFPLIGGPLRATGWRRPGHGRRRHQDHRAVLDRIDLTALVRERVDIDAIVADVDIDAIIARIDLIGLADQIIDGADLPAIIRESTGTVTAEVITDVRTQTARADDVVSGFVDPECWAAARRVPSDQRRHRLARPGRAGRHAGGGRDDGPALPGAGADDTDRQPDVVPVPRAEPDLLHRGDVRGVVLYLTLCWTLSGRTVGAVLLGCASSAGAAEQLRLPVATPRAAACVLFPIGLLWVAVDRQRRSVQDIALGSRVLDRPTQ